MEDEVCIGSNAGDDVVRDGKIRRDDFETESLDRWGGRTGCA